MFSSLFWDVITSPPCIDRFIMLILTIILFNQAQKRKRGGGSLKNTPIINECFYFPDLEEGKKANMVFVTTIEGSTSIRKVSILSIRRTKVRIVNSKPVANWFLVECEETGCFTVEIRKMVENPNASARSNEVAQGNITKKYGKLIFFKP